MGTFLLFLVFVGVAMLPGLGVVWLPRRSQRQESPGWDTWSLRERSRNCQGQFDGRIMVGEFLYPYMLWASPTCIAAGVWGLLVLHMAGAA